MSLTVSPPELKKFQEDTVKYGLKNPYSIYALGMGLGKSACGVETATRAKQRALVVCPAYLRLKWKKEIEKFAPGANITLFKSSKGFYRLWDTDFCIISYDSLKDADILFEWAECVIWDEAQMLKNTNTQRTDHAHKLLFENSNPTSLFLTGTPIVNRVWEFYSLIAMCKYAPWVNNRDFLDRFPTYVEFANTFSYLHEYEIEVLTKKKKTRTVKIQNWKGIKNRDLLFEYLDSCYIRFKSEDVLDLPPYQWIDIPVEYRKNEELARAFDNYKGDDQGVNPRVKMEAALATAPFTAEYAQSLIDQCLPVVVFSDHVSSCELIAEKLNTLAITGKMSHEKRQEIANKFQAGIIDRVVATIGSFSTGQDLDASADMIFNDPNWSPGVMEQTMYRILRLTQKKQCRFHRIIGSYQQEYIYNALEDKMKDIKEALDGCSGI